MLAAAAGHDKIVKLIVDGGADVRMKDRNDDTALEYAEKNNRTKVKGSPNLYACEYAGDPNSVRVISLIRVRGRFCVGAHGWRLASVLQDASQHYPSFLDFLAAVELLRVSTRRQSSASNPVVAPPCHRGPRVTYTDNFRIQYTALHSSHTTAARRRAAIWPTRRCSPATP